jgi:PAP2 superfamily
VIFGFMLWRGISIEPQWVVLALLLIALALGRGKQFLVDWAPFLVLFLAYEAMRGFAGSTGLAPHDVSPLEEDLFGGWLPTHWLQLHLYDPSRISLLDWVAMSLYFMHFVLPIVVGFWFWCHSRRLYWRYVSALLLLSFAAFLTYLFYPTAPPWWEHPDQVHKIITETISKWRIDYYVSPVYQNLDPNQFAAFPSLHAAYPALAAVFAWKQSRALALGLAGWALCVWIAIVYLGEHYVVDALFGLVYVVLATLVTETVVAFRSHRAPSPGLQLGEHEEQPTTG